MSESEDIDMVVGVLRKVPEKKLLLIEIANRIEVKNGEFDREALAEIQPEVERAITEAKQYSSHTQLTVASLLTMSEREREDG